MGRREPVHSRPAAAACAAENVVAADVVQEGPDDIREGSGEVEHIEGGAGVLKGLVVGHVCAWLYAVPLLL